MAEKRTSKNTVSTLTRELRQREAELAILNSVGEAMAKTLDVKTVTRIVGDKVRDIFSADQIGILLFEQQTNLLHLAYGYDKAHDRYIDAVQIKPIPLGKGLTSKVIVSRQPLLLNTREEQDAHGHYLPPELIGKVKTSESWLGVPIMVGENVMGVVLVEEYRPHMYNENHLRLLQTLSSNMGVAIQNARLFDEAQQRNAELAIINSVQAALVAELNIQGIYDAVGDKIREISHQSDVGIRIYDPETGRLHFPYVYENGGRISVDSMQLTEEGFSPHVLRTRETLVINENLSQEMEKYGARMIPGTKLEKSIVFVPLVTGGQARGLITLGNYEREHAFSESDVRLIETLANSMSVALENARLFDETQHLLKETEQRNAELAVINSIQAGLANKLDMQAIYNLIGENIRDIFKAETVAINHYDQEHDLISTPYLWSQGKRLSNEEPIPLSGSPLRKTMIDSRESWMVNRDSENIPKSLSANPDEQLGRWPKSGIGTPIIASDKVIGIIQILNMEQENTYTDADLHLLETISNSMSVALENARLFDETQQRNAELAIINSVQEGLASKLEMQAIYDLVGDKIREIFDANTVTLAMFDLDKKMMVPRYLYEKGQRFIVEQVPIPDVYKEFIQLCQPLLINNKLDEYIQRIDPNAKPLAGHMPKSVLAVPLIIHGELHGIVTLQNIDRENAFSVTDMRLLQTLANSMSVALENARLWEQEQMFRKALQRELEIGRDIQRGFLPEALPVVDGWEIAASLMSAREVAGDFYDAFELPDGNIGLVIADVCDKGVGAALFMTLFRSLIRAAANLDYFEQTEKADAPHSTTERLQRSISLTNNYIAETHGDSGMFATLFFGILDPRTGKLTYINGGHEPPLIVRDGAVQEVLRKTGPAVGALENANFNILEMHMQPGDVFFAFTDGVPDCNNPHGEFFGRERLLETLQRGSRSALGLVAQIESELRQYISGANQFDDITLLAVRRLGAGKIPQFGQTDI